MRTRRGITLIELMIVLIMTTFIVAGASRAFSTAVGFQQRLQDNRDVQDARIAFEQKMTDLLHNAEISGSAANTNSFFVGQQGNLTSTSTSTPGSTNPGAGSSNGSMSMPGGSADTLVFETPGEPISVGSLNSDDDWETMNQNLGPQGGIEEVQLGMAAVGDPGTKTGLFLREQRPADSDPSQGGTEKLLSADVKTITFEFYDGTDWQATWDTRTMSGTRRIPAAVRITYTLNGEPDNTNHIFVVQLLNSDVTATNPITQTGAAGG